MVSRPRREWLSFLCVLKCSVRLAIRSDRMATWTSAEPVSPDLRAWVVISSALRSGVIDIGFSLKMEQAHGLESSSPHLAKRQRPARLRGQNGTGRVLVSDDAGFQTRAQGFDLSGKQNDRSPLREPEGVFCRHGQRRDVVQRGLDGKQGLQAGAPMAEFLQGFHRNRLRLVEAADAGPPQGADV